MLYQRGVGGDKAMAARNKELKEEDTAAEGGGEEEGFPMSDVVRSCISTGGSEEGVNRGVNRGGQLKTLGRSVLNLAANTNHRQSMNAITQAPHFEMQ
jgi:hypothetical protein